VPTTCAGLSRLIFFFLLCPLTVLMKQTRRAVCAVKQSILLRCLCKTAGDIDKQQSRDSQSVTTVLALATLDGATQIGSLLVASRCPRWPRQVQLVIVACGCCVSLLPALSR